MLNTFLNELLRKMVTIIKTENLKQVQATVEILRFYILAGKQIFFKAHEKNRLLQLLKFSDLTSYILSGLRKTRDFLQIP